MQRLAATPPILSLPVVLRPPQPKRAVADGLIRLLRARLNAADIIWNPIAFRGGLGNPKLPAWLLQKLESLLALAEASGLKLSRALRDELDATVKDIESFNPPFRASLRRASRDVRAGRFVTQETLERRYGLRR